MPNNIFLLRQNKLDIFLINISYLFLIIIIVIIFWSLLCLLYIVMNGQIA